MHVAAIKQRRGILLTGMLLILAAALALRIGLFRVSVEHIPVTSDEAITVLQAKRILNGHTPLLMMSQPYMFPLEAYAMVPLVNFTPRNAAGMRILMLIEGLTSCACMLLIMRRIGPIKDTWPGFVLVLFPSAYYLMTHYGYSMPHHISAHILWWLAILSAVTMPSDKSRKALWTAALTGFWCGLAITNSLLSVSFAVPVLLYAASHTPWKALPRQAAAALTGIAAGLLPFAAGAFFFPGAHQAVSGTRSFTDALLRLWSPTLTFTLPRACGIAPCLFPDDREALTAGEHFLVVFGIVFLLLLTGLTLQRIIQLVKRALPAHRPGKTRCPVRLALCDLFVCASWLGLVLFLLSGRADTYSYRYLAPVTLSLPFLLACLYRTLPQRTRILPATMVILLAGYYVYTTFAVTRAWREPGFARRVVSTPNLDPTLDFLHTQGIRHCVASHWAAYRINFLTDERILCSQPLNERFPGWPIPYKDQVDRATNVAYVLTSDIRFLKPDIFERHMRTMHVISRHHDAGAFRIYYDFEEQPPHGQEKQIPAERLTFHTSHAQSTAHVIGDHDIQQKWFSNELQHSNMWVRLDFAVPHDVNRLTLHYGQYAHDIAPAMTLETLTSNGWRTILADVQGILDKFIFKNGHPVYGHATQTLRFPPVKTQAMRLRITKPNPDFCWTLTELQAFETPDTTAAGAP